MTVEPLRSSNIANQLTASWEHYKETMIEPDGRPLADKDLGDLDRDENTTERITFSETAAYVLLRAAWMNDEEKFTDVWDWTKVHLQRINRFHTYTYSSESQTWLPYFLSGTDVNYRDHLFAWRWVPSLNGPDTSGGIIYPNDPADPVDRSGLNAASDDLEIVAALYFAYLRGWGEEGGKEYLEEARLILQDAWKKYVVQVGDQYYLFAGDQFSWSGEINPSYFRPAYYSQIFPLIDPTHPWGKIAESSYKIIIQSGQMTLNGREGVGLPPNWVALSYTGQTEEGNPNLTESRYFPGVAGEIFGWDAFRTLWGVAQDCAWFDNPVACSYLTDEQIGPAGFLSENLHRGGRTGFHHDGKPIDPDPEITQTRGLNRGQLFMYGAYVAFFQSAGRPDLAEEMLARLKGWEKDQEYFTQNWVPLGLMLASGLPGELKAKMQEDIQQRATALSAAFPKTLAELEVFVSQVDIRLGEREPDGRIKLDRELAVENLSQEQIFETLQVIANAPDKLLYAGCPSVSECYPQLEDIYIIDQNPAYEYLLLPYFANLPEYWNNAVTLLSVYSQKVIEENRKEDIAQALEFCKILRTKMEQQEELELITKEGLVSHAHSLATLDLTEAELRAQTKDQDIFFYQDGIFAAVLAIDRMLDLDPTKARPDYFLVTKALLTIGDLYLRMYEATEDEHYADEHYMDKASEFYSYVAQISEGVEIQAEEEGLFLSISPALVREALEFNYSKGYLDAEDIPEAEISIYHYLKGMALVKEISLFIRRRGEKNIQDILAKLDTCNQALEELNISAKKSEDFFISFATLLKADLLLFLADRIKFYLWPDPNDPTGPSLGYIETSVEQLSDYVEYGEMWPRPLSAWSDRRGVLEKLSNLNDRLIEEARGFYLEMPSKLPILYAQSKTKLTEIAVRTVDFMDREFRYLLPLYTDPVLNPDPDVRDVPISDDEFLGIELNYLKALLLISQATITRKTEKRYEQKLVHKENLKLAEDLLGKVLENSAFLNEPYQKYFQLLGRLKLLEITLKSKEYKFSGKELDGLMDEFKGIEGLINSFSPEELREMAFNPASLKAELYSEWANVLLANDRSGEKYAILSLENCYRSDSPYDLAGRRVVLLTNFAESINVRIRDQELQTTYFGGPQNVH